MRELLRDREFVAYFAARQGGQLGYSIETVAIGWQIYGLRHNPLDIGLVGLVLFLPALLLAIPAGMIADRFDRRLVCAPARSVRLSRNWCSWGLCSPVLARWPSISPRSR